MKKYITQIVILCLFCMAPIQTIGESKEVTVAKIDQEMDEFVDEISDLYVSSRSIACQTLTIGGLIVLAGIIAYVLIDNAHTHVHMHSSVHSHSH